MIIVSVAITGCTSPSDVVDNLYTKNVYPDVIAGPFTIGDVGNPYGAGYFDNLYIGGTLFNGSCNCSCGNCSGGCSGNYTNSFDKLYANSLLVNNSAGNIGNASDPFNSGYFTNLYISGNTSSGISVVYDLSNTCYNYSGDAYIADPVVVGFSGALWFTGDDVTPIVYGGIDFSNIDGVTNISSGLYELDFGGGTYVWLTVYYMYGQKTNMETWMDGALWFTGDDVTPIVYGGIDFSNIDGVTNISSGLYELDFGGGTYVWLTVYYMYGQKTNMETWMDGAIGAGNWQCDDYYDGLFIPSSGSYSFSGYPSGWTLSDGYTSPVVTDNKTYKTQILANGNVTVGNELSAMGNITQHGDQLTIHSTNPRLLIGTSPVPFLADFCLQAFKAISNSGGNVAGGLFGLQDSSNSPVNYQMWGLSTGLALYGDTNYNWPVYGLQAMTRVDINDHTINTIDLASASFAMSGGSHLGSSKSTIGSLTGFGFDARSEGADPTSRVYNMYGFKDSMVTPGFLIDNFYGIWIGNHSGDAVNSWGIYNQDKTYLGGLTVLTNGELQPASVADATASNNSIYLSTNTGNLSYKDSSGNVHMFVWQ
jgi:hypothetical protein